MLQLILGSICWSVLKFRFVTFFIWPCNSYWGLTLNYLAPGSWNCLSVCLSVLSSPFHRTLQKLLSYLPRFKLRRFQWVLFLLFLLGIFVITLNSLYLRYCRFPFQTKINNNTYTIIFLNRPGFVIPCQVSSVLKSELSGRSSLP